MRLFVTSFPAMLQGKQGLFWRLSELYARSHRRVVNPVSRCQLRQREALALVDHVDALACVVALGSTRSPATIVWCVITICIDAIQGITARSWPHVAKKGREVVQPRCVHLDTTPAVMAEVWKVGVVTPAFRGPPRFIFRLINPAAGCAVLQRPFTRGFDCLTAATGRLPTPEILRGDKADGSAVALTQPIRWWRLPYHALCYQPPSVALASEVNKRRHNAPNIPRTAAS